MAQSILSTLMEEILKNQNHDSSIERCRAIIKEIETTLDKRVISYFASENGTDASSMVNDEDVFFIENLLNIPTDKKDLILILHSNGGYSISAERIIDVCRNYCSQKNNGSKFIVIVPKKAKSAATIVALGSDKIYLRETAELGPVDPQFIIADNLGQIQVQPAYLYVDALENFFYSEHEKTHHRLFKKIIETKPIASLAEKMKVKLLEQCNYAMYVNAKNEIGLSDSIVEKIAKEKTSQNKKINYKDFDIFRDPHITKSHGRLINFSDLKMNTLRKENVIECLDSFFEDDIDKAKYKNFDNLLWELYVRKRQLLNDTGHQIVKTIESSDDFFINLGMKSGQKNTPPEEEVVVEEKT